MNTNLVTILLSEWGYSVYIKILLGLSPAPTIRAFKKYDSSDVTFVLHTFVDIEWLDQLTL